MTLLDWAAVWLIAGVLCLTVAGAHTTVIIRYGRGAGML